MLQVQGFEHVVMPNTPASSSADTYGSGYLDSLLSHQVYRPPLPCGSVTALFMLQVSVSRCMRCSSLPAGTPRLHLLAEAQSEVHPSLLQDDHLDAALLLEGLDFDLDMSAPEFAAMASAMVH